MHKKTFFRAGSLRLIPPPAKLPALRRDYDRMQGMFFGERPDFDDVLRVLKELENRINAMA